MQPATFDPYSSNNRTGMPILAHKGRNFRCEYGTANDAMNILEQSLVGIHTRESVVVSLLRPYPGRRCGRDIRAFGGLKTRVTTTPQRAGVRRPTLSHFDPYKLLILKGAYWDESR